MNKKIIINCLFLFLLQISLGFSQEKNSLIRIEYRLKYLPDTNSNIYFEEPAELFVDKGQSYFVSTQKSTSDSIAFLNLGSDRHIRGKSKSLRIHKDFGSGKSTFYESFYPKEYMRVEEDMANLNWKIKNDTASMFGYLCQKATLHYGGRDWTAWFATEVPISDGPYKFCGLPGLIVRMSDSKNQWFIDFVSLNHLDQQKLDLFYLKNARKMSAAALLELQLDLKENYMERMEAAGLLSFPPESRAQMIQLSRDNLKKDNNEIEMVIK